MTDLGELGGEIHDRVDIKFGYYGHHIRVNPNLTDLVVVEMFRIITTFEKEPARSLELVDLVVTTIVHPDDDDTFRAVMLEQRVTIEDLTSLAAKLLEVLTGRPTLRPSDSSAGPPTTGISSEDADYSAALRLTSSRPDLQAAVVMANRDRLAAVAG